MKIFLIAALCLLLSLTVFTQDKIQPNQWRGLTLDKSTYKDVLEKLGLPSKDGKDRIMLMDDNKNFSADLKKKNWRVLRYKNIEQIELVRLGFNSTGVLIFIELKPKTRIPVQSFLRTYDNTSFKPMATILLGMVDSKVYTVYGKNENAYVLGMVVRGVFSGAVRGAEINVQTQSNDTLDGSVGLVQLVSPSLENKDNTNILK